MRNGIRRSVAFLFVAAFVLAARPAHAQMNWTIVGVGEFDTDDVVFVLGGVSVSRGGTGWSPVAGVSASWLQYPFGLNDAKREVITVTPTIGLRNGFDGGSFQARVGYAFRSADEDINDNSIPVVAADVGDGVMTSAQLDYWGKGNLGAQAIGSYNFGSESLWARGRLTHRLFGFGDAGHVRAGIEAAVLSGENYDATQIGAIVGFHPGRGAIINAGIGRKLSDAAEDATYFRFELVLTPAR